MMNLIKMECYKLRTSKLFMILLAVAFAANLLFSLGAQMLPKLFVPNMPVARSAVRAFAFDDNRFCFGGFFYVA